MRFLYSLFINLYALSIRLASPFNPKAKSWVEGRKNVIRDFKKSEIFGRKIIWVHTASLGEFEQGRPIIEELKITYPNHKILLTFFSPSGYEVRKNYEYADYVCYLPADTLSNASRFINAVNPEIAIFIKYEFWYNYIYFLYKRKIPLIFASVIFRRSQHFFKFYGRWFVKQLNRITYIYVQDQNSLDLLDKVRVRHAEIGGDTRFDRVVQLPKEEVEFPLIEKFKGNSKVIIGGSTWPMGEAILKDVLNKSNDDIKLIIAPHVVSKEHINEIITSFAEYNPILYSDGNSEKLILSRVLIINKIGFLSMLYRYAYIAYIGGGFGVGLHNVLEASTYGIPVLFGAGFFISNSDEAIMIIDKLNNDHEFYSNSSKIASQYVKNNAGATPKVINKVKEYIIAG